MSESKVIQQSRINRMCERFNGWAHTVGYGSLNKYYACITSDVYDHIDSDNTCLDDYDDHVEDCIDATGREILLTVKNMRRRILDKFRTLIIANASVEMIKFELLEELKIFTEERPSFEQRNVIEKYVTYVQNDIILLMKEYIHEELENSLS